MLEFEEKHWSSGKKYIAGIDEAGRGPLAGPVVAAAVILPHEIELPEVNDSKKISEKKREWLFDEIYDANLNMNVPLNLQTYEMADELRTHIKGLSNNPNDNNKVETEVRKEVIELCSNFPIYNHLIKKQL